MNAPFQTNTSHPKSMNCLDILSFSHTNSLKDHFFPLLRLQLSKKTTPLFPFSILTCFLCGVFFFFLLFHFHFLYYRGFFIPFWLLLMTVSQGKLFTFTIQTLQAAEVGDNYSCCWRLCRLPRKTKKKIFQQQVAAWVSTCELPAQPTLSNPAYFTFHQQIILFHPPRFNPLETDFPNCNASEATGFSASRYNTLSKGYALKSYFDLPI